MKYRNLFLVLFALLVCSCSQERSAYKVERAARLESEGRVEFEVFVEVTSPNYCSIERPWL
jgi:hypothetical protein